MASAGAAPAAAAAAAAGPSGTVVPLDDVVSARESWALNLTSATPLSNLFHDDDRLKVVSDADEQLLFHFAFNEGVNLTAMRIKASGGKDSPRVVKLFVNRVSMGFDDCDSTPPAQTFELKESDYAAGGVATLPLRTVKFTRVVGLTVFVQSNLGDVDATSVGKIRFTGVLVGKTDVAAIKKVGHDE